MSKTIIVTLLAASSAAWGNWPQFRGPHGDGHVFRGDATRSLPLSWSEDENVKWKTPIPGRGWSTPVIWGNQIWLTTATETGHEMSVICIDRETGDTIYNRVVFQVERPRPLGNDVNTYASPSSLIEEGRVYVHFGSYGTACIDTKTYETVWERRDLPCNHFRGPASSLAVYDDLLLLTMDGSDLQYQVALNKTTGQTVWKTDRTTVFKDLDVDGNPKRDGDFRKAFDTPLVVDVDGQPQMFVSGSYGAFSYDPRDGRELWRLNHDGFSNASMALYGHGCAFMTTGRGRPELVAVRPEVRGEVTDEHIAWRLKKGIPVMVSMLLVEDMIFFVNHNGIASCVDAKTGKIVWKERVGGTLGGNYYASPVYADGRIYFFSDRGVTTIVEAGRTFKELAVSSLEDGFMASPAVVGDRLYLRSKSHLYCIQNKLSDTQ